MTPASVAVTPPSTLICPPERLTVPPVSVGTAAGFGLTTPSFSNDRPEALCVPETVTVYAPVASVPAENTALYPAPGNAVVPTSPAALALQFDVAPSHVPLGVAPP